MNEKQKFSAENKVSAEQKQIIEKVWNNQTDGFSSMTAKQQFDEMLRYCIKLCEEFHADDLNKLNVGHIKQAQKQEKSHKKEIENLERKFIESRDGYNKYYNLYQAMTEKIDKLIELVLTWKEEECKYCETNKDCALYGKDGTSIPRSCAGNYLANVYGELKTLKEGDSK